MAQQRHHDSPAQRQAAYRRRQAQATAALIQAKGVTPLPSIANLPGEARWKQLLQTAQQAVEIALSEMNEYHQARTELWQEGERGTTFMERSQELEQVSEALNQFCIDFNL